MVPEIESINSSFDRLRTKANSLVSLSINKDNWLNKQLGKLSTDLNHIHVIAKRLKNDIDISDIQVDIKSVYLFARVMVDDFVYTLKGLFENAGSVDWTNFGNVIRDLAKDNQPAELKSFWIKNKSSLNYLYQLLDYRTFVTHTRESTVEWTMQNRGEDAYENARIENVPWNQNAGGKGGKTDTPKQFVSMLSVLIENIVEDIEAPREVAGPVEKFTSSN